MQICMLVQFVVEKLKTPGGKKKPKKKADGGMINKISQDRKMISNYGQGGIAKGCGGVMKNRRKVTKRM